ncbi:hypothetical protein K431DRAFT_284934 [Polychaeton citri CBS 116435]|uniref:Uncharacterized protein n=1 Tax=Polychaeton citri CBS 116435 TaxID=1314669 RepID=A0A9P4Q667_9PEZI|nr:hypothetical protein K431DRAFT_284934 [Polychaeton citri CBS 116435]
MLDPETSGHVPKQGALRRHPIVTLGANESKLLIRGGSHSMQQGDRDQISQAGRRGRGGAHVLVCAMQLLRSGVRDKAPLAANRPCGHAHAHGGHTLPSSRGMAVCCFMLGAAVCVKLTPKPSYAAKSVLAMATFLVQSEGLEIEALKLPIEDGKQGGTEGSRARTSHGLPHEVPQSLAP